MTPGKEAGSRRSAGTRGARADAGQATPAQTAGEQAEGQLIPARQLTVGEENAGQRVDNFILGLARDAPRSWAYRVLRKGEVRVNGGRSGPDRKLAEGDVVRVPPMRLAVRSGPPNADPALLERLEAAVLFEDESLLVIDKPAGIAVHGGSGERLGVIEALRQSRPDGRFLELAHRLDKETSGCLVLAKKRAALVSLHAALRDSEVDKRYLLLVRGRWARPRTLTDSLRRSQDGSGERRVRIHEGDDGKASVTQFRPLAAGVTASLVEARPQTGRTHQIRVHAASAGHPLAGDRKYGHKQFNQRVRALGLRRLFLHAHSLGFRHPTTGRRLNIRAPLPSELERVLEQMELGTASGFQPPQSD